MDRLKRAAGWAWELARDIGTEWSKDRVGGLAAEIAFFALLGFFPTVIVLAAALGSADGILGENTAADVESHFSVKFKLQEIMKFKNVGDMCDCIAKHSA